ncbi:DUF4082 domain-containing protein, partial [Candidatus Uhrbacteria bacterium]|nr:DUF4082 domain-containing protein [Candidatus Uhrbacteria bacterium]
FAIGPASATEGDGVLSNACEVRISGPMTNDLAIAVVSLDESEATVTNLVTIAAGVTNASFDLTVMDELLRDGTETATVQVSAALFVMGSDSIAIVDDDVHHFDWAAVSSPQTATVAFAVTVTAKDIDDVTMVSYTGPADLTGHSLGTASTNLLGSPGYLGSSAQEYTVGYSFRPSTNLTVTHVRHCFGTKVSVWTDDGTLLVSQPVSSVPPSWCETALPVPLMLSSGVTYRVAGYSPAGSNCYWRSDMGTNFANGVLLQAYNTPGDGFPTTLSGAKWFLVGLRYSVLDLPMEIAPTIAEEFAAGVWSGDMLVMELATNVHLRATDASGYYGDSGLF